MAVLTRAQIDHIRENGGFLFRDLLDTIDAYEAVAERLADKFAGLHRAVCPGDCAAPCVYCEALAAFAALKKAAQLPEGKD